MNIAKMIKMYLYLNANNDVLKVIEDHIGFFFRPIYTFVGSSSTLQRVSYITSCANKQLPIIDWRCIAN